MVSQRELSKLNESIDINGQRTLISGGTQGIGAGLALRFALGGSSIWLVGRNQGKADDLIAQLKLASAEASRRREANGYQNSQDSKEKEVDHRFFKADLSNVDEMKRVVEEIGKNAGEKGIDWLIECQGGPPSGSYKPPTNDRSPEFHFSVQCLSRFTLASQLASQGILKRGACMIGAPGGGSKTIDTEDLDLKHAKETGKWKPGIFGLIKTGGRDSAVLDSVTQTLAERHPNLLFSHLFPGYVSTDSPANVGFPFPIPQLASVFGPYIGSKPGPGGYAEVPFYLLSNPDGNRYLRAGEANLMNDKLKRLDISKCVDDRLTREKVWESLENWLK